jgi:hypothetical protein
MVVVPKEEKDKSMVIQPISPVIPQHVPLAKTLMDCGKFEVKPDQTFTVKLHLKEHKGRWVVLEAPVAGSETHSIVFRMWNFDECLRLRREATTFDVTTRINKTDNDKLNRMKIMKFMQEWTLGKENPRLEINRVNGTLTDESWRAFTRLPPIIADRIISEMNMVLEYGG